MTPRSNPYIQTKIPNPKQTVFYLLNDIFEILYGGAAGGGKSEALLYTGSQFVDIPGYSALILRRSYKELAKSGALMDRSHRWFANSDAKWDGDNHAWRFPYKGNYRQGATLAFGYLERDADLLQYQSAEYQFIGFDELTQFPENIYLYMFSRIRRPKDVSEEVKKALAQVPLRMRGATNPGGPGWSWVKKRWKLHGIGQSDLGPDTPDRRFVFARLEDNPHLDQESYERSFDQLSTVTYAQLRLGDMDSFTAGGRFEAKWFTPISADEIPQVDMRLRYWDLAASEPSDLDPDPDWTAGALVSRSNLLPERYYLMLREEGVPITPPFYYIEDIARFRYKSGQVEDLVRATARKDGSHVPVWIEQERGATGKGTIQRYRDEVLPSFRVHGMWLTGPKPERIQALSSRAQDGRFFMVVGPWNEAFLDEAVLYTGDNKGGPHDDQLDAVSGTLFAMEKESLMGTVPRARQH